MFRRVESGKARSLCEACWQERDELPARTRAQRADSLPPEYCEPCEKVHILSPENALAWRIFMDCRTQQIRGPEGSLVGLSHVEFRSRIEAEDGHEPRETTWRKLLGAEQVYLEWHAKQREKQRKEHEEKSKREAARRKARH